MTSDTASTQKHKRDRSPAYPGIDLRDAIERANVLYQSERRHFAPVAAILEHWGYTSNSSNGMVVLASLKKFGLVDDEGTGDARQARITDLAFDILEDNPEDSAEKDAAIRKAALLPTIHRDLWNEYEGELPSPATLRHRLKRQKFTDRAVDAFITEFTATLAFAGLDKGDIISLGDSDKSEFESEGTMVTAERTERRLPSPTEQASQLSENSIAIPVLLGPSRIATITIPMDVNETEWETIGRILRAYGLPERSAPATDEAHSDETPWPETGHS